MHEASLVQSLLEQVRRLAQAEGGGVVTSIELELGPLSGVEPELVGTAFQRLAPDAGFARARLELLAVPLVGRCVECRREFEIVELRFVCPAGCGGRIDVVRGDGCVLKRFTLEAEPAFDASAAEDSRAGASAETRAERPAERRGGDETQKREQQPEARG